MHDDFFIFYLFILRKSIDLMCHIKQSATTSIFFWCKLYAIIIVNQLVLSSCAWRRMLLFSCADDLERGVRYLKVDIW